MAEIDRRPAYLVEIRPFGLVQVDWCVTIYKQAGARVDVLGRNYTSPLGLPEALRWAAAQLLQLAIDLEADQHAA